MDYVYLIVIIGGMVSVIVRFDREAAHKAEQCFVDMMEQHLTNFNEYSPADIEACIENGYEGFGAGNSIQLHWSDT